MGSRHHLHGDMCSPSHSPQKATCPSLSFLSLPQRTVVSSLTLVRPQGPLAGGLAMGHELVLVGLSWVCSSL